MKIAYLVSRYPAVSHAFVLDEVLALRARGVQVDTFAIRRSPPEELLSPADREAAGSTFVVVPPSPLRFARAHLRALARDPRRYVSTLAFALLLGRADLRRVLWQLFYFAEAIVVFDECDRRGIRHLHAHFANVATDVAMIAVRFGGNGWSWSFTLHGPVELADVSAHRLAEKVRSAALVVCISDFARSQLMSLVPRREWTKLQLVRCGIDTREFSRNGHPVGAHEGMHVITVGRLSARKAHAVLVEAIAALRDEGAQVRLTVVGDGEERAALETLARELELDDRVTFAGAVAHDELADVLAAADVFCLPSVAEGLPVVLMEAMAMGLPVVAARIMGIPELVEDGVTGYTVAPGRADALADALRRLAGERDRWPEMGAAGRRKVEADHDLRRSAASLHELLTSAAPEPVGSAR